MKTCASFLFSISISIFVVPASARMQAQPKINIPAAFESYDGKFVARGRGYVLTVGPAEIALRSRNTSVRMKFSGANPASRPAGIDPLPGTANYLIGNDSSSWRTRVPLYSKVQYCDLYAGIDLVQYGKEGELEYDFIVSPGADPGVITMAFSGVNALDINKDGDLLIDTAGGELRHRKPEVYQEADGRRVSITGRYVLTGNREVRIETAAYDHSRPLVIDPILMYLSYLGGGGNDAGTGIATDSSGNIYVAGYTDSQMLPPFPPVPLNTPGVQPAPGGGLDGFIVKLDPTGTSLLYATYIGGTSDDMISGLTVDSAGNAYVTGRTTSTNFPVTNAFQGTYGGGLSDAFAVELNAQGDALLWSTYLGGSGSDEGRAVALRNGDVYVAGATASPDFPSANGVYRTLAGGTDAFLTKLSMPFGTYVPAYSTYLGGEGNDRANALAVDWEGAAYIAGTTRSFQFPAYRGYRDHSPGCASPPCWTDDAFAAKFDSGGALVFATYLGGLADDSANGIAVGANDTFYLVGQTKSPDFPTTAPDSDSCGTAPSAFVSKLAWGGSYPYVHVEYASGICWNNANATAVAADAAGNLLVAGLSTPVAAPENAFMAKLGADMATMFGYGITGSGSNEASAIAVDSAGLAYVTGWTNSTNLPVTSTALQHTFAGMSDVFVAKIRPYENAPVAGGGSYETGLGEPITISLTGSDPDGDALQFSISSGPANGALTSTPPNRVTYTPNRGFSGQDRFEYSVSDGYAYSLGTVYVLVRDNTGPAALNIIATPNPAPAGSALALTAKLSDASTGNNPVTGATYAVNNTAPVAMNVASGAGTPTVDFSATLPPSAAGVNTVCVQGTDAAGNTGAPTCVMVAVYDPTAGFVTGSGAVLSPAGTDLLHPTATGLANFGFSAKYLSGSSVPSGALEFYLKEADLKFRSSRFNWLVVGPGGIARIRGEGDVDGAVTCSFQLQIWTDSFPPSASDALALQIFGCADGKDRYNLIGTPLSKGNIAVH